MSKNFSEMEENVDQATSDVFFTNILGGQSRENVSKDISAVVRRDGYIEIHAYPDEIAAEADPKDDPLVDANTNDFDVYVEI